jgi:hypothetical protein
MTLPIRWLPKMPLFSPEKMHAHPRSLLDSTLNFFFKKYNLWRPSDHLMVYYSLLKLGRI